MCNNFEKNALCVRLCVHTRNALSFKNDILRCLQALCLHSAFFQPLLFKNQSPANDRPQETVKRITPSSLSLSFALSLFLSPIHLCQKGLSLCPSPATTRPPPFPYSWLERVASECQMYYRVSHGNVNTQPCHESRVVWPPSPLLPSHPSLRFPFPLFPPSQQ